MTDAQTAHYDTFQNVGRSVLVLDSIRAVCEAINNDALAASKEQPVMAGIENNCSALGTTGQLYTTIPLRPLTGDCNFLLNNYIHHRIPFRIPLESYAVSSYNATSKEPVLGSKTAPQSDIDFAISFLGSSLIPKRFQLMIGNTIIYQNTFQRTEATVAINSLPPDVVEKSDDITTLSKLLNRKTIPGHYFTWTAGQDTMLLNFTIDTTIDLQRFAPILSNIAFIPVEYGDLKLRLFYDDLFNALDIYVLPDNSGTKIDYSNTGYLIQKHNNLHVIERRPLLEGAIFYEPDILTTTGASPGVSTVSKGNQLCFKIKGSYGPPTSGDNNTTYSWGDNNGTLVEIVQSTFRLREESKILLRNYIMSDNRLIIPTHTWSTALALNGPNANGGVQLMWNFTAYNIDLLAFTFPIKPEYESYLPNPLFKTFDVKLNSKSLNYLPYSDGPNNSRFIKDTKQAFLNTDEYATNENLTYSLKPFTCIQGGDEQNGLKTAFFDCYSKDSAGLDFKPNTFCYAVNLSPPNSFEKGMCVASSNPQAAQVRITYETAKIGEPSAGNKLDTYSPLWSNMVYYGDTTTQGVSKPQQPPFVLALQGCCLVLIYNPIVGACQAGEVVFVEPFLN